MFSLTINSILAKKVRFLLTGVAVILGVAFMAGTLVLTDTIKKSYSDISANVKFETAYSWWVAGFVTGANLAKGRVISTDNEAHIAWLKQYCRAYFGDSFADAAIELDRELDTKREK